MPSSLPIHPLGKLGHPDPAQATGGKFEYDFIIVSSCLTFVSLFDDRGRGRGGSDELEREEGG